jgi:N-acylneuraminate cytidylyltransferase
MNIAIIPARGGSKRIPRKNIKEFCGKPIIAWSIEAAIISGLFEKVIVSTDDDEIAEVARHYGAEVPFMRPPELANDFAGTTEVIAHGAKWAINQGFTIESVCCIYATAPFIRASDLKNGFSALNSGDWFYVFSATEYVSPVFRSFKVTSNGGVEMLFPELFKTRSQDFPIILHDAAQFCWGRSEAWLDQKRVFGPKSKPLVVPSWRVVDIDTQDDWVRAEYINRVINQVGE